MRDVELRALVAAAMTLAFGEVLHGAVRSIDELLGQRAAVLAARSSAIERPVESGHRVDPRFLAELVLANTRGNRGLP